MEPRFPRLRPVINAEEAIAYLRAQPRSALATLYYASALDKEQRLLGVVSFRELIAAPKEAAVSELMERDVVTVTEDMDQEKSRETFSWSMSSVTVVDSEKRVK